MIRHLPATAGGVVPDGWTIILSNEAESRLVLYNPESRQIAVQTVQAVTGDNIVPNGKRCPLCQTEVRKPICARLQRHIATRMYSQVHKLHELGD
jgi:uncharacterized protein with PIN domain